MHLTLFKKEPTSIMVELNQQETWDLILGLVEQMQKNSPNVGRKELLTPGGDYFSITVKPDPIKSLTGKDRHILQEGLPFLTLQILEVLDKLDKIDKSNEEQDA